MVKKRQTAGSNPQRANRASTPPPETTYSIRLDPAERALLIKALTAKGWKPTHFIRQAALEKAAQIDNTSKFTKFDFDLLARRLAKQLCAVEVLYGSDYPDDRTTTSFEKLKEGRPDLENIYEVTEPPPFQARDVDHLRDAVKLGGSEFLRKVLEECDRIVMSPNELPPPVDPAQFV